MTSSLPVTGRPLRIAAVGLGQISELMVPAYLERADIEIVGLCDPDPARLERWAGVLPDAVATADLNAMLRAGPDVVDVLVPTPLHGEIATRLLDAGVHVQVQKPIARSVEDCDRMMAAAARGGAVLRVLEDYLFFPPIATLRDVVASGEIGHPAGLHMKIVGTGRGGWDVPMSSYLWQFEQAQDGRGMLVFDHGWHQFAVAHSMFGPIEKVFAWVGTTQPAPELAPHVFLDAPSTLVWQHASGVRGVLDITLAPEMLFRSEYYSCDERIEVTGTRGFARCNRISSFGVQEPSVVVYEDGRMRAYHALDDTPPAAFRASAAHAVDVFTGSAQPVMSAADARAVLCVLEAAIESARVGTPVTV